MIQLLKSRLTPFQHKAFRNFFFVQALSLIGSWSHDLARAYIVIEMMGQAGALGSLMLAGAIPSLLLMMQGGVLVDRIDNRKLMMITKCILAVMSLALAFITEFSNIQLWQLLVFAIIEGVIISFDSPAYQTLTVRLVPLEDFQQAIAINSTNFHTARMIGPIVAGLLMAWHGPSLVFLFDGLSFLGLIFVLKTLSLRDVHRVVKNKQTSWAAIWDGLCYLMENKSLRFFILQLLCTIIFIFPILIVIFRTYIKLKYNLSADQFGYVFAFPAAGAMLGSLMFAAIKPKKPTNALKLSVPLVVGLLCLVPQLESLNSAVAAMTIIGFFTYLCFASLTVSLQLEVKEEYRGRMGAIIGMSFMSIGPLMSFPIGVFADKWGYEFTIYISAIVFGFASALLALLQRQK
ncbi:MAG: MFS transporter [Bdellovibrionaceae bacterium]|nr:MFS transporter [Pseudobdellovibrionaceae bacterium]